MQWFLRFKIDIYDIYVILNFPNNAFETAELRSSRPEVFC